MNLYLLLGLALAGVVLIVAGTWYVVTKLTEVCDEIADIVGDYDGEC